MQKYFCKYCKGLRNHKNLHKVERRGSEDEGYIQWYTSFSIIECFGCENISFLKVYGDSEMIHSGVDDEPSYYFDKNIYPLFLESSEKLNYLYARISSKIKINKELLLDIYDKQEKNNTIRKHI